MVNDVYLDVRVDVLGPGAVAFTKAPHRRDGVGAQHSADLATLAHQRSQCAGQEAGLVFLKDQADHVRYFAAGSLELVHTDELDVWILWAGLQSRLTQPKAHGHDHVEAGIGELGDVLGVVLRVGRLDVLDKGSQFRFGLFHAFPRGLVERLVVNLAHIGHQAHAEDLGLRAILHAEFGRGLRGCLGRLGAAGCQQCHNCQQTYACQ